MHSLSQLTPDWFEHILDSVSGVSNQDGEVEVMKAIALGDVCDGLRLRNF
ncbi:MAG: hypothetical protein RMX96_30675 [Nostoc sp. ChiSLP02]|nr:hypothetical protein [Nostoc sp. DedSLP05]MDZ8098033.1 hypothetical protein [Nostoc sp. DedSLP01]MDZ8189191.1 hypothetical protein [Nostoc sp. ChiSLP02]